VKRGCSPPHREHPPAHQRRSMRTGHIFLFCDLKMVNSAMLTLKFVFIVSSLSWVRFDSVANFGFLSKAMNTRRYCMLSLGEDD